MKSGGLLGILKTTVVVCAAYSDSRDLLGPSLHTEQVKAFTDWARWKARVGDITICHHPIRECLVTLEWQQCSVGDPCVQCAEWKQLEQDPEEEGGYHCM